jgi:hypothetical protein
MSTRRHNPASNFRLRRTHVTWNGHRYLTMPTPARIGPIYLETIGYQSVRRCTPPRRGKANATRVAQNSRNCRHADVHFHCRLRNFWDGRKPEARGIARTRPGSSIPIDRAPCGLMVLVDGWDAIPEAGRPLDCKPQGLPKAAGGLLVEADATATMIMSILDHTRLPKPRATPKIRIKRAWLATR